MNVHTNKSEEEHTIQENYKILAALQNIEGENRKSYSKREKRWHTPTIGRVEQKIR